MGRNGFSYIKRASLSQTSKSALLAQALNRLTAVTIFYHRKARWIVLILTCRESVGGNRNNCVQRVPRCKWWLNMLAQTRWFFLDDQDEDLNGVVALLSMIQDKNRAVLNWEIKFFPGSRQKSVRSHLKWCVYTRCCFTRWALEL